jgi:aspartate aminotransferase-like enzyme
MKDLQEIVPVGAEEYAAIEDRFVALLGTQQDLVVLQGEAVLPLEAAARGLGRPGSTALNVVTSPYGATFGDWLRAGGSRVVDIVVPVDQAVSVEQVAEALQREPETSIVSLVHAEAGSGVVNPLREIAAVARAAGALVVVDAVGSVGAEPLAIDDWELDLVVLSAQKALAGPTGVSAAVVSDQAWSWLENNPSAPRRSLLSLLDWRERWLGAGRTVLPVIPHHVELRLLGAALDQAAAEGLASVIGRHRAAADDTRRGLQTLGLEPWVRSAAQTAAIATTVRVPPGAPAAQLLEVLEVAPPWLIGAAPFAATEALRINHTGLRATAGDVERALGALSTALQDVARS